MFSFTQEQIRKMGVIPRETAAQSIADYLRRQFRPLVDRIGSQCTLALAHSGIVRAERWGFLGRQEVYRYLSIMILLGEFFDDDPQLPWARDALRAPTSADERLHALWSAMRNYLRTLAGTGNTGAEAESGARTQGSAVTEREKRLRTQLEAGARGWLLDASIPIEARLQRLHPEKFGAQREADTEAMLQRAKIVAASIQDPQAAELVPIFMFCWGIGCWESSIYPHLQRSANRHRASST